MKKFNAKYITRTVLYTEGTAIKANLKTRTMEEVSFRVIGSIDPKNLLDEVREVYGLEIIGIDSYEIIEEKRRISVDDFLKYSEIVTKEEEG